MCRRSEQRRPGLHACDRSAPAGTGWIMERSLPVHVPPTLPPNLPNLQTCLTLQPGAAPLLLRYLTGTSSRPPSITSRPLVLTDCIDCLISVPLSPAIIHCPLPPPPRHLLPPSDETGSIAIARSLDIVCVVVTARTLIDLPGSGAYLDDPRGRRRRRLRLPLALRAAAPRGITVTAISDPRILLLEVPSNFIPT